MYSWAADDEEEEEGVRKGQQWLGVVLACFCWVTSDGKHKGRRNRRMRGSEAGLPEVRKKEKDGKVRRNVLDLELCV